MSGESKTPSFPVVYSTNGNPENNTVLLPLLSSVFRLVRSYRKAFVRSLTVFGILGVALAMAIPPTYTARATILPPESTGGGLSRLLSALPAAAAQMLGTGESKLVELYVDIARSQSILSAVLDGEFRHATLRDALRGSGEAEDWQLIEDLRESLAGSKHPRTQLVMLEYSHHDPVLASALLNGILRQMDSFFRYRMATNENVQRRLIETRLAEVADSLRMTEELLRQFREGNRATVLSPKLTLEEQRLLREVSINNALYVELARQLELARISEAETMPLLNVLDYPVPPRRKSGPSRALIVAGMLCIGIALTLCYIYCRPLVPGPVQRVADRLLNWRRIAND